MSGSPKAHVQSDEYAQLVDDALTPQISRAQVWGFRLGFVIVGATLVLFDVASITSVIQTGDVYPSRCPAEYACGYGGLSTPALLLLLLSLTAGFGVAFFGFLRSTWPLRQGRPGSHGIYALYTRVGLLGVWSLFWSATLIGVNAYEFFDTTNNAAGGGAVVIAGFALSSVEVVVTAAVAWAFHRCEYGTLQKRSESILRTASGLLTLVNASHVLYNMVAGMCKTYATRDPAVASGWMMCYLMAALARGFFVYTLMPIWVSGFGRASQLRYLRELLTAHAAYVPMPPRAAAAAAAREVGASPAQPVPDLAAAAAPALSQSWIQRQVNREVGLVESQATLLAQQVDQQNKKLQRLEAKAAQSEGDHLRACEQRYRELESRLTEVVEQLAQLEAFTVSNSKLMAELSKPKNGGHWFS